MFSTNPSFFLKHDPAGLAVLIGLTVLKMIGYQTVIQPSYLLSALSRQLILHNLKGNNLVKATSHSDLRGL